MRTKFYPTATASFAVSRVRQKPLNSFPWSKITLSFLMISTFLIFATPILTASGPNGTEAVASWSGHISEIIAGTALFSLATILLVWAGRMYPKNM